MSTYTVDDSGQVIITPPELDQFEYYRDNILVRRFQESMDFKYAEIVSLWRSSRIFDKANFWGYHGAVIDSNGDYHVIIPTSTHVWHHYQNNGSWVSEAIVVHRAGGIAKILIDGSGYLHVLYTLSSDYEIYYANNTTGSWVPVLIKAFGITQNHYNTGDIFIDSSGYVHLFYVQHNTADPYYSIVHATNISGWATEIIDSQNSTYYQLSCAQYNSLNSFALTYSFISSGEIKTAIGSWGSWSLSSIPTGVNAWTGALLLVDSSDNLHFFYGEWWSSGAGLSYANNISGWSIVELLPVNKYQHMSGFLRNGKFYISFTEYITGEDAKLQTGTNESGDWVFEIVMDNAEEEFISIRYGTTTHYKNDQIEILHGIREDSAPITDNLWLSVPNT